MTEGLFFELHGVEGEGSWFRLYECEHITEGSYPILAIIPIGPHANMLLCKHCWQHTRGMVAQEFLKEGLLQLPPSMLKDLLSQKPGEGEEPEGILQSAKMRARLDAANLKRQGPQLY